MRIKRILYPVKVLGPGNRVGIWTTGCNFSCQGCTSPELKSFNAGKDISVDSIIKVIQKIESPIDGFTISGGEPFEQADELLNLLIQLNMITDDIILYTGYYYEELSKKISNFSDYLSLISVLIDGRYIDELNTGLGLKGSANQNIIILKNHKRYENLNNCKRELQTINLDHSSTLIIGII